MTENEVLIKTPEEAIETIKSNMPTSGYQMLRESLDMAIKALEEIQQYREIGTVEECLEAREKQKPKAPKDELKINPVIDCNGAYVDADTTVYLLCPNCGEMVGIDENVDKFCRECGQAIDENLEEWIMELENKYAGSEYNSFCEYFCELTELLDNITEKKRLHS